MNTSGILKRSWRWSQISLRLRLTLLTTVVVALALIAGGLALSMSVSHARVSGLAAAAASRADAIAQLAVTDQVPDVLSVTYPGEIAQLVDEQGQVIITSSNGSKTLPIINVELQRVMAGSQTREQAESAAVTTQQSPYSMHPLTVVSQETQWQGRAVTVLVAIPAQEVFSTVESMRTSLFMAIPALVAGWAFMAWVLLGRALRPVEDLRRGAEAVTLSGGSGTLPVPRSRDEIAALAQTLNAMLDRLRASSKRQAAFVADAAHELRSPLAALRITSEVAQSHPDQISTKQLAQEFLPEIVRMQDLVDDLLVLARMGSVALQLEKVDLVDIVQQACNGSMPSSSALDSAQPPRQPMIIGTGNALTNPGAATRIIRNLVDNAHRYGDRVQILISQGSVTVADDGPGIAEPDRDRVFDRFVRLDDARTRDAGGSGLGLAIVRELATDLGGAVSIVDSPLGGTAVKVVFQAPDGRQD